MEFFNLVIVVPIREVFLLEVLLELFPHNFPFINLLHFPAVLPPYGCPTSQIEDGYSSLHISWIVLDLEILPHPKKPSFNFLSSIYLAIKRRRFSLLKFIPRAIPMVPLSLSLVRRKAWIPTKFFWVRWSTRSPSSSSFVTTLTTLWFYYTWSKDYLSLQVCQTLQHSSIQLMLLFLGFN